MGGDKIGCVLKIIRVNHIYTHIHSKKNFDQINKMNYRENESGIYWICFKVV